MERDLLPPHKNDYAELKKERLTLINSKIWLEWGCENDTFGCSSI